MSLSGVFTRCNTVTHQKTYCPLVVKRNQCNFPKLKGSKQTKISFVFSITSIYSSKHRLHSTFNGAKSRSVTHKPTLVSEKLAAYSHSDTSGAAWTSRVENRKILSHYNHSSHPHPHPNPPSCFHIHMSTFFPDLAATFRGFTNVHFVIATGMTTCFLLSSTLTARKDFNDTLSLEM